MIAVYKKDMAELTPTPEPVYKHPVMDRVVNTVVLIESAKAMRLATYGGAIATSADVIYMATNQVSPDGPTAMIGYGLMALTVGSGYLWRTATRE